MDKFVPFIHEKNKKQKSEPLPLHIEVYDPHYEPRTKKEPEVENSDSSIIVIEL